MCIVAKPQIGFYTKNINDHVHKMALDEGALYMVVCCHIIAVHRFISILSLGWWRNDANASLVRLFISTQIPRYDGKT